MRYLFQRLEIALRRRNPQLSEKLQPGLAASRIQQMLDRAAVRGAIEPIVSLFSWKNGADASPPELTIEQRSLFPNSIYMFTEIELLICHFRGFREALVHHPEYLKVVERFFPLFWDGSNS